jgi:uncharacterized protein (DUF2252 family)
VLVEHVAHGAREGPSTGQQLVQDHAERVEVGARVELTVHDLLGRHVRGRAVDLAVHGEARICAVQHAHQAEVEDDHAQAARAVHQHQVLGVEVAVHEAQAVRRAQAQRHLPHQLGDLAGHEAPALLQSLRQRGALQQLHGHEHQAVGRHAEVVHLHHVGVV